MTSGSFAGVLGAGNTTATLASGPVGDYIQVPLDLVPEWLLPSSKYFSFVSIDVIKFFITAVP